MFFESWDFVDVYEIDGFEAGFLAAFAEVFQFEAVVAPATGGVVDVSLEVGGACFAFFVVICERGCSGYGGGASCYFFEGFAAGHWIGHVLLGVWFGVLGARFSGVIVRLGWATAMGIVRVLTIRGERLREICGFSIKSVYRLSLLVSTARL